MVLEAMFETQVPERSLHDYRPFWAHSFGVARYLPMSAGDMEELGWDSCDIILVTGDAYIDHPSFGMALIGRLLESHGFRVGIIAQPSWTDVTPFRALGRPNLFFGITAGNMDSMVNRYTSDRKIRHDDAYTPDGVAGKRPDRAVLVYANRCREACGDVPIVIGGIEASLRRIAHYDYWSEKVRRSILVDSRADLLLYGNAERAIVEIAHRLGRGDAVDSLRGIRGTAYIRRFGDDDISSQGFHVIDSTRVTPVEPSATRPFGHTSVSPYVMEASAPCQSDTGRDNASSTGSLLNVTPNAQLVSLRLDKGGARRRQTVPRSRQVIRLPAFEDAVADEVLYAHASRILHLESNPHNARALVQRHGDRDVWLEPPPIPLTTEEMDAVYELPYARTPHPSYGDAKVPAYEMIRFSVTIMRGCFGGCTFCSITEHEGRIIQNRSESSVLREIEKVRDRTPGFTGVISDVGGPTANMYRLACKSRSIEAACRLPSCVYPDICQNLDTNHDALIQLYRKARAIPGIKKVLVASGLRYDLAVRSPEYIAELAAHHVGGYLKIAPEHTESGPLDKMMKPGIGAYDRFKKLFDRYSKKAGKKQYLIPYFIAAHPGTTDEDMLQLALWLKHHRYRADQVQAFLPSPMASATTMYHTGLSPLRSLKKRESVDVPRSMATRRLHKAFLRYHDSENWPVLRDALRRMGRQDLIGNGPTHLIPYRQPRRASGGRADDTGRSSMRSSTPIRTQHTGLPPSSPLHRKRRKPSR